MFIFTNFSVKSDANEVVKFNFTNFFVKSDANEVVRFNFTKVSVPSHSVEKNEKFSLTENFSKNVTFTRERISAISTLCVKSKAN